MWYSVVCGRRRKHTSPTESVGPTWMIAGDYSVLKESPSGHFIVQPETGRLGGLITARLTYTCSLGNALTPPRRLLLGLTFSRGSSLLPQKQKLMTSAKLLLYNCFIMPLCSPDNNAVADVFVIICPPPLACYQGLQVIVEKIMTACPPCSFSSLWIKEAAMPPFTGRLPLRRRWLECL